MNLSIIIPNYNGEKLLRQNLPKVLAAVKDYKGKVEIIIADDPSTDTSAKTITAFIKSIKEKHIIGKTIANKNKKEAGFSKNVNRGVSLATGEILILLNTDVAPHKDFLQPLLAPFADEKMFAVGCMDESIEREGTVLRGRGIGRWQRGFLIHSAGSVDKTNTLWVSGGSSAFRRSIWDKLKGLDVLYNPFYWEDIDLSYRALKSGYKTAFASKSIVVHEHEKGAIKKFKKDQVQTVAYRNQFIFVWKNITDKRYLFSHLIWLPYHFATALTRGDWKFFQGFFAALALLGRIQEKRRRTQKSFVLSDRQILAQYSK